MNTALYFLCSILFLGLLPNGVVAKKGKGGGGGGVGKGGGSKSGGSPPVIFVSPSGGNSGYCRNQLTNAVVDCPLTGGQRRKVRIIFGSAGGVLLLSVVLICCYREYRSNRRLRLRNAAKAASALPTSSSRLEISTQPSYADTKSPAPKKTMSWLGRIPLARPRQFSFPLFQKSFGKYERGAQDEESGAAQIYFPNPAHYKEQSSDSGVKKETRSLIVL